MGFGKDKDSSTNATKIGVLEKWMTRLESSNVAKIEDLEGRMSAMGQKLNEYFEKFRPGLEHWSQAQDRFITMPILRSSISSVSC